MLKIWHTVGLIISVGLLGFLVSLEIRAQTTDSPFLSSPIANHTPFTIPISSVFDHTMAIPYERDLQVVAFTGERGFRNPISDCYAQENDKPFTVNGNYVGTKSTGGSVRLCYDGHPAYDFPFVAGEPVLAAADGTVVAFKSDCQIDIPDCSQGAGNFVKLGHGNGYQTLYFHLKAGSVLVQQNQSVKSGQKIAEVDTTGNVSGSHLHFEVRKNIGGVWVPVDPYGWQGVSADPYTRAANVNLWETTTP